MQGLRLCWSARPQLAATIGPTAKTLNPNVVCPTDAYPEAIAWSYGSRPRCNVLSAGLSLGCACRGTPGDSFAEVKSDDIDRTRTAASMTSKSSTTGNAPDGIILPLSQCWRRPALHSRHHHGLEWCVRFDRPVKCLEARQLGVSADSQRVDTDTECRWTAGKAEVAGRDKREAAASSCSCTCSAHEEKGHTTAVKSREVETPTYYVEKCRNTRVFFDVRPTPQPWARANLRRD